MSVRPKNLILVRIALFAHFLMLSLISDLINMAKIWHLIDIRKLNLITIGTNTIKTIGYVIQLNLTTND